MLSTIFSDTANFIGQVVGETVHQTGNLVEAAVDGTGTVLSDIANIPSALAEGYDKELFEATPTPPTDVVTDIKPNETTKA